MSGTSLLELVRGLLERTYRMQSGLSELAPFLIGDRAYHTRFGSMAADGPASAIGAGARTLVRELESGARACIYYPDTLIRCLESYPPQRGLGAENVDAFAVFVEEIDHLLLIAERVRLRRPVSLFELELHANVSKYLVLVRFLAGRSRRLDVHQRLWLRHRLFERWRYREEDPAVCRRYGDAARWAVQLIDRLARLEPASRIDRLRRFHDLSTAGKLELIGGLAA